MGRLDWNREVERNRHVLESIVALLFSLAGLADRACELRGAARLRLLGFLGHGEAVARTYIIGLARDSGAPAGDADAGTFMADGDAERLAVSLRVLALALGAMLALARRVARAFRRATGLPMGKSTGLPSHRRAPARSHGQARGPPAAKGTVYILPPVRAWESYRLSAATK